MDLDFWDAFAGDRQINIALQVVVNQFSSLHNKQIWSKNTLIAIVQVGEISTFANLIKKKKEKNSTVYVWL